MPVIRLDCTRCDKNYPPGQRRGVCDCGGVLFARYDLERAAKNMRPGHLALRDPTLWRYDDVLPVEDPDQRLTLGEGFTPLLSVRRLGILHGLPRLYVKDESGNPTGSFKARGLCVAVSMAKALGVTDVVLPSAGNAGSALAAYAARGGLKAHVFLPADIPPLFLLETQAMGADVRTVHGNISDAGRAADNLLAALAFLNQSLPPAGRRATVTTVLDWAIAHWRLDAVPRLLSLSGDALPERCRAFAS